MKSISLNKKTVKSILWKKDYNKDMEDITKEKSDKCMILTPIQKKTFILENIF